MKRTEVGYVLGLLARLVKPGMNDGVHEIESIALGPDGASVFVYTCGDRSGVILRVITEKVDAAAWQRAFLTAADAEPDELARAYADANWEMFALGGAYEPDEG